MTLWPLPALRRTMTHLRRKLIPGFKRKTFKEESLQLYKQVCGLLAQGDKTELRQVVTPAVFSDMKRQLKQREDGGWARVQWDIVKVGGWLGGSRGGAGCRAERRLQSAGCRMPAAAGSHCCV